MNGSETGQAPTVHQDLTAEEFAAKMKESNTVVLDVRTRGEIARGKIEGAVELDYRSPNFAAELAALDPDKTYLVYCASGGRSAKACTAMDELGYGEVYNLLGGYGAWKK
ncbi:hypothetical protein A3850_002710 [Lewinella sp. 4G2]|nr:hypothetical protein A3850_002710 [Lewinella sp. 4G2]